MMLLCCYCCGVVTFLFCSPVISIATTVVAAVLMDGVFPGRQWPDIAGKEVVFALDLESVCWQCNFQADFGPSQPCLVSDDAQHT